MQTAFSIRRVTLVDCKNRKKELPLLECVDAYVTANAIPDRRSACFRCLQGQQKRAEFAAS